MLTKDQIYPGKRVRILDRIQLYDKYNGVIKYIEPDNEIPELLWLYIIADDEHLNDKVDPRFMWKYFMILEDSNEYIFDINDEDGIKKMSMGD